jgi:hypothetical protein
LKGEQIMKKNGIVSLKLDVTPAGFSKDQDIDIVGSLRNLFKGEASYLRSLFTDELVVWVTNQVRDDLSCDLVDLLKFEQHQRFEDHRERIDAEITIVDLRREVKRLEEVADTWESRAQALGLASEKKGEELNLVCDDVNRLTSENSRLKNELTDLKARLYDLEHP